MNCGAGDNHISVFFRPDEQNLQDGSRRMVILRVGWMLFEVR